LGCGWFKGAGGGRFLLVDELEELMQGRFHPNRPRPCAGKRGGGDFRFLGAGAGGGHWGLQQRDWAWGEQLHGLESLDDASSS